MVNNHANTNDRNHALIVVNRPNGPVTDDTFAMVERPIPSPGPGTALLRNLWLSFDPTQRGWLQEPRPFLQTVELGEPMRAYAVAQVVESRIGGLRPGQLVEGRFGWQDWELTDGEAVTIVPDDVTPQETLGIYGTTGMTAYFGVTDVLQPRPGDVAVVSGAAGGTGSIAGQLLRLHGARTIGVAGGPVKCDWLTTVARFDAAIDYKTEPVAARLGELAPKGIDLFFDNVGGQLLDDVLARIRRNARIALCGAISTGYSPDAKPSGPSNYFNLCLRSSTMRGFRLTDYTDRRTAARSALKTWVTSGELVHQDDVQHGLENAPATLRRLFEGKNLGKQLLKIADPPLARS